MKTKDIIKYISYILIAIIVIYMLFSVLSQNIKTTEKIEDNSKISIDDSDKKIDISNDINPDNYESLEEFIWYFNSGSGVVLDVDMEKEVFYTKNTNSDWTYVISKFDDSLISHIDNSSESIKNKAIMDIYNSYKEENFLFWEPNDSRAWVRILEEDELDSSFQMHNDLLIPYNWENYFEKLDRLESKVNKSVDDYKQLWYLYDFSWDYKKANILKKENWIKSINYKVSWKVFNQWEPLSNVEIEVLNTWEKVTTDDNWYYEIEFETYPLTRARFRARIDWFSDWYNWVYIIFDSNNQSKEELNFNLHKYDTKELIKQEDLSNWKIKTIESTIWNSFDFVEWVVIDSNWEIYTKDFYAYIYEFDRQTPGMENFLWLDNFDPVYWYSWDMMVTAWMTYMMMTTLDWEELFISKKNPIVTRQQINMDIQYNNDEEWTNALTKEQFELLLKKSKEPWYNIDRTFLEERWISGLSPWWVLNKTRWVWENRPIKIINKDWLKESLYYNVD